MSIIPRNRVNINILIFVSVVANFGLVVSHWMRQTQPLEGQRLNQLLEKSSQKSTTSKPTPSPKAKSNEPWISSHLINCENMTLALESVPDTGIFVRTKTKPSFLMSIHDPSKDIISKQISDKGCWECQNVRDMLQALEHYGKDSYLLDIGGNIGMWSLAAAAANHRLYAIEAMPDNVKRFCRSVNRNSFHDNTHLTNIAATDRPGRYGWAVPKGGSMGGTVVYKVSYDRFVELAYRWRCAGGDED